MLERMEPSCYKCGSKIRFSKIAKFKKPEISMEEWKCEKCGEKVYMDVGAKAEYDKHFNENKHETNSIEKFMANVKTIIASQTNKKITGKLQLYVKRIENTMKYLPQFGEEMTFIQINLIMEEIIDIVIPQITDYLKTSDDRDDILQYYSDFTNEDLELYVKTLQLIYDEFKKIYKVHLYDRLRTP
jgi:PHP family Zn ribbon phosphoesterase